ncbi:hypothetical protein BCR44DRAFT_1440932 [Catenaria anguillulae PL171]|uniref:Uncharacterized protein n=1 Tax=Catenaria anguillulae PL171 TaxID=765915 RepID=A0A1Y2HGJ5_9FUNG|nr:hypothetical protein BCR44DRAFT_1440932 [Catenaria anguillulae PL171]
MPTRVMPSYRLPCSLSYRRPTCLRGDHQPLHPAPHSPTATVTVTAIRLLLLPTRFSRLH